MQVRTRTRPPGRSSRPSTRPRRTSRTASAGCAAGTSTRARPTRPAPRWSRRSPRPRAERRASRSRRASPRRTRCCARPCGPGDHVVVPNDAYGGTYRLIARVFGPWGIEHTAGRPVRPRRGARRDPAGPHQGGLGRDADQPAARHRRHRGARRARPRGRRAARRRQHLRDAVPAAAARARRGRRRALDDQVHRRALGRRRRGARRRGRCAAARSGSTVRRGRRAWPTPCGSTRTRPARSPGRSTPG